jgi:hypothetical protein
MDCKRIIVGNWRELYYGSNPNVQKGKQYQPRNEVKKSPENLIVPNQVENIPPTPTPRRPLQRSLFTLLSQGNRALPSETIPSTLI